MSRYCFIGTDDKYRWNTVDATSTDLLAEDGLRVLDLGCGAGRIVRDYNQRNSRTNKAYGITARTYGEAHPAIIVGNIHHLDDVYPADLGPLDLSITRHMYKHLADPLSVLEMMACHLKKGGLMVVDSFSIRASIGSMVASHVLKYLTRSGHFEILNNHAALQERYIDTPKVHDGLASYAVPTMLLRRKSPFDRPVELPVSYNIDPATNTWQYHVPPDMQ